MDKDQIALAIERVVRNEIDDAQRYAKNGDAARAASELDDAERKLKKLARAVRELP